MVSGVHPSCPDQQEVGPEGSFLPTPARWMNEISYMIQGTVGYQTLRFFLVLFNLSDWWMWGIDGTAAEDQHPQALN